MPLFSRIGGGARIFLATFWMVLRLTHVNRMCRAVFRIPIRGLSDLFEKLASTNLVFMGEASGLRVVP